MSLQGLLRVEDFQTVSYIRIAYWETSKAFRTVAGLERQTVGSVGVCLWICVSQEGEKSKANRGEQAALLSLINIDSSKGNSILLYMVKTQRESILQLASSVFLIKKQQLPLKRSIPTKEAKERIPLPIYHPSALSIQRHMEMLWGLSFFLSFFETYNRTFNTTYALCSLYSHV